MGGGLVRVLRDRLFEGPVRRGRRAHEAALRGGLRGEIACRDGFGGLGREVADRREYHLVGGVRACREGADRLAVVAHQRRLAAQDVVAQFRTFEQHVLEGVVDQVGGRILVGVDLVDDHLLFALQLPVGERRAESDVGDQLRGLREVALQRRGVNRRVLLGGEGVQLPAEVFQAAVDLPCLASLGPLEKGVLRQVRQSVLRGMLVAAPGADHQRAVRHGVSHLTVNAADAVGECIGREFHSIEN